MREARCLGHTREPIKAEIYDELLTLEPVKAF